MIDVVAAHVPTSAAEAIAAMVGIDNPISIEGLKAVVSVPAAIFGSALEMETLQASGVRAARAVGKIGAQIVRTHTPVEKNEKRPRGGLTSRWGCIILESWTGGMTTE